MNSSPRPLFTAAKIVCALATTLSGVIPALADNSYYELRNDSDCPSDPYYPYRLCDGVQDARLGDVGSIPAHTVYSGIVIPQCANGHTPGFRLHFLSGTHSNVDFDMAPSPAVSTSYEVTTDCNSITNDGSRGDGGGGGDGPGPGGGGPGPCMGDCHPCEDDSGMPVWRLSESAMDLWITDEPVGYSPAAGPRVSLRLAFKQRELLTGLDTNIFGAGKKWNFSWFSYVTKDTNGTNIVLFPGGGIHSFTNSQDYLTNTRLSGETNTGFTVSYPDGHKNVYGFIVTNGSGAFLKAFMTEHWNANSQKTTFYYSSYNPANPVVRLLYIVDGDGRTNSISYVSSNPYSTNLISQVSDPFGRTAYLTYDDNGHLTSITDVASITSSMTYSNDLPLSLTTPYGTTGFTITDTTGTNVIPNGRSILISQPDGGHQLYLYKDSAPGIPATYPLTQIPDTSPFSNTIENTGMNYRNTFYWGPKQYDALSTTIIASFTTNDFQKARMRHWLKDDFFTVGQTISMERNPSPDVSGSIEGQKTWYDYKSKSFNENIGTQRLPLLTARVLPDGTRTFTRTDRNSFGAVTTNISTYSVSGTILLRTNVSLYASDDIDMLTMANALGVQTSSNSYNAFHQVVTNYNALGEVTTYTYNSSHELTSTIRPTGLITTNIYDANGLLVTTFDYEIVGGSPVYYRTNSYTYANNLVYTHTDERGLITTSLYDNLQRLTNSSDSRGAMKYIYTNLDLVQVIDRMGFTNSFGYDPLRRKIAETNALGYYTLYSYCNCGSLDSIRDAAGNTNVFFYDNAGRLLNTVYADGFSTTNNFNLIGQTTNTIDSGGYSVTNWFNNQGLLYAVTTAAGNQQFVDFDILDRATNSVDSEGVSTSMTYDNLDRLLARAFPDGGVEHFGYSPRGLVAYTNQIGLSNFFTFDALGRKTLETNANNEVIRSTNNAAGDLLSLTDGKGQTTRWNYDQYGRVTNKLDQLSAEILRYKYDIDNRLTNRWSAAKGDTYYSYDNAGNLTFINYPSSPDVTFAYDSLNRMTNMVDASGTTKYTYTTSGQLLTENGPFGSDTVTNTYSNRLRTGLSLQQPTGTWTNGFAYDTTKRLTNVTSPAGVFGYSYDPSLFTHHASRITLPNTSYITNTYDGNARLTATYLKNSGSTVLDSYAYIYNPANQRTNLTRLDGTVAYRYDKIGQLIVADSSVSGEDTGYSYDHAWNVSSVTNSVATNAFLVNSLNELTNWAAGMGTCDANGNMTSRVSSVSTEYVYDDENRLIGVTNTFSGGMTATYLVYDGLGRLRLRYEMSQYGDFDALFTFYNFVYDGFRVIQERNIGIPIVGYTHGNDLSGSLEGAGGIGGLLARSLYASGNPSSHFYYFADANGNVTYMLDGSQGMAASYRYDPFGNTISISGAWADNPYRFSSKEFLVNSGLYYFGYRFYDPSLQRWINKDPIGLRGGLNPMVFVRNTPVNKLDPLGLQSITPPLSGPACPFCLCQGVEITYYAYPYPAGPQFHTGFFADTAGLNAQWIWGTLLHVQWNVVGNPNLCHYYQDESQFSAHAAGPDGPIDFQGHDGNEVPQSYWDRSGFYPNYHGDGHYVDYTSFDVTFRCVSSPSSLPGVSRREGPYVEIHGFDFPQGTPNGQRQPLHP